jgi:hypothetical protein
MRKATAQIYQLKVELEDIEPPIWRRILVAGDITLGKLHEVIQEAVGWSNTHLHEFTIEGQGYSDPEAEIDDNRDELQYRLSQVTKQPLKQFQYLYDPGDGWEHNIIVEQTVQTDQPYHGHPVCIDGARACPPEDCGGPFGYEDFLAAITNPKHKQHKEMRDWIGGDFDPEHFDPDEINDILRELSD